MDEMERRTQQAHPFYCRRGECSPACIMCVCSMRAACGGPGGLAYRWASSRISVGLPWQRNPCTDCKSAQLCTTRGHPLPLPEVTSGSVQ